MPTTRSNSEEPHPQEGIANMPVYARRKPCSSAKIYTPSRDRLPTLHRTSLVGFMLSEDGLQGDADRCLLGCLSCRSKRVYESRASVLSSVASFLNPSKSLLGGGEPSRKHASISWQQTSYQQTYSCTWQYLSETIYSIKIS